MKRQAFKTVSGHEVGRIGTMWTQFYITTPDGGIGLIDDSDWEDVGLPDSCLDVTEEHLETMLASVWRWADLKPEEN